MSPSARADSFKIGIGIDYSVGDASDGGSVTLTYIPVSASYQSKRWGLKVTVPYLRVDGPGTVLDESGQLLPGPDHTQEGIGDVVVGGTLYDVIRFDKARLFLDIGIKAKLGTASREGGLGTGENDYSIQLDLLKNFGRTSVYGTAGYRWRGDPEGEDLRNNGYASLGGDYRVVGAARAGLQLSYRPSATAGGDEVGEATVYLLFVSGGGLSMQPYFVAGLGDSATDWGAGVLFGLRSRRP